MKRIIYCSQASYDFAPDELVALLKQARFNNEQAGLSGMLLYCAQSFLQLLEGDGQALEAAYAKIVADDRHTNLRMLAEGRRQCATVPGLDDGFEHVQDEELAHDVEAFTPAIDYPLVNPDLITNAGVAQTLLQLYARNRVQ